MSSINAVNFENAVDMIWEKVATSRVWQYLDRSVGFTCFDPRDEIYCYYDRGVEIRFTEIEQEPKLVSIILYLEATQGDAEDPGFKRFEGILPYRLPSGLTKQVVLDRFGEPTAIGKEQQHPVFGRMLPWIKYYPKDNVQILFEHRQDEIVQIHFSKAIY
ncbi:hypothetical protein [Roseibium sp. MMSF_3247]|uniref:hypothetical protein n=2 Tax=unclassified Roseibium TaxID=2629323 RepID=UPI00273DFD19|nr:hypothetical protein [Roseibium sp. MMSF_3247]